MSNLTKVTFKIHYRNKIANQVDLLFLKNYIVYDLSTIEHHDFRFPLCASNSRPQSAYSVVDGVVASSCARVAAADGVSTCCSLFPSVVCMASDPSLRG